MWTGPEPTTPVSPQLSSLSSSKRESARVYHNLVRVVFCYSEVVFSEPEVLQFRKKKQKIIICLLGISEKLNITCTCISNQISNSSRTPVSKIIVSYECIWCVMRVALSKGKLMKCLEQKEHHIAKYLPLHAGQCCQNRTYFQFYYHNTFYCIIL